MAYSPASPHHRKTDHLPKGGPGRKKGVPNKITVRVREMAQRITDDPVYFEGLVRRARQGKLHAAMETMLWHYAYGPPKAQVQVSGLEGITQYIIEDRFALLAPPALDLDKETSA